MPDALIGRIKFPGLQETHTSCTYTCTHGIQPGVIAITFAATEQLAFIGQIGLPFVDNLVLDDGQRLFTIWECRVASMVRQREGEGLGYMVTLYDRRWKWRFGTVSGLFNERDTGGRIKMATKKTIAELAEMCLEKMGERKGTWDITALPELEDESLPAINWDYANAAQALEDLCEQLGCRIVFQPIANRVLVAKPGKGADLPDEDYTERWPAREAPPTPETLRFVGAPAAFVCVLVLEAVGEDLDGSVVPIADLSYIPANGWEKEPWPHFNNVLLTREWQVKGKSLDDCKAAARKSVYRWYRVTMQPAQGDEFEVSGLAAFDASDGGPAGVFGDWQIIPLDRIIGADRDEDRDLYIIPARVYGRFTQPSWLQHATARVTKQFSIDSERGIVMFSEHMVKTNLNVADLAPAWTGLKALTTQTIAPADLVLECSIHVRDHVTRQPIRFTRDRKIPGGKKDLVQIVKRDDVQFAQWNRFKVGEWKVQQQKNNRDEVNKAADHFLDAADDFEQRTAETKTYPQLLLTDPDGAIQAVTWECSGRVMTTISRNTERVRWLPPWHFRRGQEKFKANMARLAAELISVGISLRTTNTPLG